MDRLPPETNVLAQAPPIPLEASHWQATLDNLGLKGRLAEIVELTLRDLSDKQIAFILEISESTLETHRLRINLRLGVRGRMQLAMRVLNASHEVRHPPQKWNLQQVLVKLRLTGRLARIVELTLNDLTDIEIANELQISQWTVESHRQRINLRLGVRGRMQLAMRIMAASHEIRN